MGIRNLRKRNLLLVAGLSVIAAVTAACGSQVYQLTDAIHTSQAGHDVSASAPVNGPADVSGTTDWAVSNGSLYLSGNSGHSWSKLALPAGVSAGSVAAVTASGGSAVWLAADHGNAVELYRRGIAGQSAWTTTGLPASAAPAGVSPGQSPNQVVISQGSAGTLTLLEVWDQSPSASIPRLFVSSNDGASFTQLAQPNRELPYLGLPWWTAVFASARDGVAVVGGARNYLIYTSDGGQHWSRAALTGIAADQYIALGTPFLAGKAMDLPVFAASPSSNGAESASLLVSQNGGASFGEASAHPVTITGSTVPGPVPMAASGNVVWLVPPGRTAFVSRDNGRTWTQISLPFAGATAVSAAGPASATIVAGGGYVCSGPKQQSKCPAQAVKLWSTADNGLSWQDVTPGVTGAGGQQEHVS
jgi:hypothetical protein